MYEYVNVNININELVIKLITIVVKLEIQHFMEKSV